MAKKTKHRMKLGDKLRGTEVTFSITLTEALNEKLHQEVARRQVKNYAKATKIDVIRDALDYYISAQELADATI